MPVAALIGARTVAQHQVLGLDGWRWLLIAGGLGALFVLLVRRRLPESPRWLEANGRLPEAEQIVLGVERRSGVDGTPTARPVAVTAPSVRTAVPHLSRNLSPSPGCAWVSCSVRNIGAER